MNTPPPDRVRLRPVPLIPALLVLAAVAYALLPHGASPVRPPPPAAAPPVEELTTAEVMPFCTQCHAFPPPDILPRSAWRREIGQMYDLFARARRYQASPPVEGVVRYYERRAPQELPLLTLLYAPGSPPVRFESARHPRRCRRRRTPPSPI
jgi:hypothetical protein